MKITIIFCIYHCQILCYWKSDNNMPWWIIRKCKTETHCIPSAVKNLIRNSVLSTNYYKHSAHQLTYTNKHFFFWSTCPVKKGWESWTCLVCRSFQGDLIAAYQDIKEIHKQKRGQVLYDPIAIEQEGMVLNLRRGDLD